MIRFVHIDIPLIRLFEGLDNQLQCVPQVVCYQTAKQDNFQNINDSNISRHHIQISQDIIAVCLFTPDMYMEYFA